MARRSKSKSRKIKPVKIHSNIQQIIDVLKKLDHKAGSFEITDELFYRDCPDDYWFSVLDWLEIGVEQGHIIKTLDKRGWKVYSDKK